MSALGDRLREAAQEADRNSRLAAFAAVVTENTTLSFFAENIQDEDEARAQVIRGLANMVEADDTQSRGAALWGGDQPAHLA